MKRVLISGGAGFIGSNLAKRLLSSNYYVIVVDNFITSSGKNLEVLSKHRNFVFIKHDITSEFTLAQIKLIGKVDEIFHLACPTGVPNLLPLAEQMLLTCSVGTRNILEIAKKTKAKVMFTSSSEVYGNPKEFPQTEAYTGNVNPTDVRSPYEEGKRFSESIVSMYVRKYGVDAKIVRIFNTYGPCMSLTDTRVIPRFLSLVKENKPLTVHGDGKQTRTFCYIDDLINGLLFVLEKGSVGEVYNVGSDNQLTIRELAELIRLVTKTKSKLEFVKRANHDHDGRLPDLAKIKSLGWQSTVGIYEGLLKTYEKYL